MAVGVAAGGGLVGGVQVALLGHLLQAVHHPLDHRVALLAGDGLAVRAVIALLDPVLVLVVHPGVAHIGVAVGHGLTLGVEPALGGQQLVLIGAANLGEALQAGDGLAGGVQVALPDDAAVLVPLPLPGDIGIADGHRRAVFVQPGLIVHLTGLVIALQQGLIARRAVQRRAGSVIALGDHLIRVVVLPADGGVGVALAGGLEARVQPALLDGPTRLVIGAAHHGVPGAGGDQAAFGVQVALLGHMPGFVIGPAQGDIGVPGGDGIAPEVEPALQDAVAPLVVLVADLGIARLAVDRDAAPAQVADGRLAALAVQVDGPGHIVVLGDGLIAVGVKPALPGQQLGPGVDPANLGVAHLVVDGLTGGVQVALADDVVPLVVVPQAGDVIVSAAAGLALQVEPALGGHLAGLVVAVAHLGIALRGQGQVVVGVIIGLPGDAALAVVLPGAGGVHVAGSGGQALGIKPGLVNHLAQVIPDPPHPGIAGLAEDRHLLGVQVLLHQDAPLAVQGAAEDGVGVGAAGGQGAVGAQPGPLDHLPVLVVPGADGGVAVGAEDGLAVRPVIVLKHHPAFRVVLIGHGGVGIAAGGQAALLVRPPHDRHLFEVVVHAVHGVVALDAGGLAVRAEVGLLNHIALLVIVAADGGVAGGHDQGLVVGVEVSLGGHLLVVRIGAADDRVALGPGHQLAVRAVVSLGGHVAALVPGAGQAGVGAALGHGLAAEVIVVFGQQVLGAVEGAAHQAHAVHLRGLAVRAQVGLGEDAAAGVDFSHQGRVPGGDDHRVLLRVIVGQGVAVALLVVLLAGVGVILALQHGDAAVRQIVAGAADLAVGHVFVQYLRVAQGRVHRVAFRVKILGGSDLARAGVGPAHLVVAVRAGDGLPVQEVALAGLALALPGPVDLIGALFARLGLVVFIHIDRADAVAVRVVDIGGQAPALGAGHALAAGVHVFFADQIAARVIVEVDLRPALRAVDGLAAGVQQVGVGDAPRVQVVAKLRVAQGGHDHGTVVLVVPDPVHDGAQLVVVGGHPGIAGFQGHALAVRAEVALVGHPVLLAQHLADAAVAFLGHPVAAVRVVPEGGDVLRAAIGVDHPGKAFRAGAAFARFVVPALLHQQVAVVGAPARGVALLRVDHRLALRVKVLAQGLVVAVVLKGRPGIAVRAQHRIAVRVQVFLLQQVAHGIVDVVRPGVGQDLLRPGRVFAPQQLPVRPVKHGGLHLGVIPGAERLGVALLADDQLAGGVVIALFHQLAVAVIEGVDHAPALAAVHGLALGVQILGLLDLFAPVGIADRGVALVVRHHHIALGVHIALRGHLFVGPISALNLQVGGNLRHRRRAQQRRRHQRHPEGQKLFHQYPSFHMGISSQMHYSKKEGGCK